MLRRALSFQCALAIVAALVVLSSPRLASAGACITQACTCDNDCYPPFLCDGASHVCCNPPIVPDGCAGTDSDADTDSGTGTGTGTATDADTDTDTGTDSSYEPDGDSGGSSGCRCGVAGPQRWGAGTTPALPAPGRGPWP